MSSINNTIDPDHYKLVEFSPGLLGDFLYPDGALRDFYIDNTSIEDWEKVLALLKKSDFKIDYFIDYRESVLPANASLLFTNRESPVKLQLQKDSIIINSYFFIIDQIEFDIDPREFIAEEQYAVIFDFLNLLNGATNKPIKLCYENSADTPFLIFFPGKQIYISTTNGK